MLATLHPGSYREAQERHAGNYVVVMRSLGVNYVVAVLISLGDNYVVGMILLGG